MSSDDIIELNIGGTVFEVLKSTLINLDGFFKTMLETDVSVIKDEFGRIFIDRSPRHFELILKFMREGRVNFPHFTKKKFLELLKEAQFYMLIDLVEQCNSRVPSHCKIDVKRDKDRFKEAEKLFKTDQQDDIVKLDVGGTIFQTTKSTLMKFDGFFKTILETNVPVTKNESECIIINRDPKHFETILNYMRDGHVALYYCYEIEFRNNSVELMEEADYYMLDGLIELCKEKIPVDLPAELKIINTLEELIELCKEKIPMDFSADLKIIETEKDIDHFFTNNKTIMPVVVVEYSADSVGRTFPSEIVKIKNVANEYKDRFPVYFRPTGIQESEYQSIPSHCFRSYEWRGKENIKKRNDINNKIKKNSLDKALHKQDDHSSVYRGKKFYDWDDYLGGKK